MTGPRWAGNQLAQTQADAAFNAWRAKHPKKKKASKSAAKARRKKGFSKRRKWIRADGTVNYHLYMASAEWRRKRDRARNELGGKCQSCGTRNEIQVHHKTYRNLGREPLTDLELLCKGCHENHHEGKGNFVADPMTREYLEIVRQ